MVGLLRLTPGSVFAGCFEVLDVLAEGGMGTVYSVIDRTTGEPRALKVLLPELTADETSRRRFAQEGLMASQLQTPYAVRVHGVGVDAQTGMPWITMDLLRGRDLRAHIREHGAMSVREARPVLEQLGEGLAAAHARGWVHRDLKPENVFLDMATGSRRVKLLDFGVAKMIDLHRTSATGTGAIGSPLWMAPEQTSAGGRIAPATDVFAYGLVAFYVMTGTYYWQSAHDDSGVGGLLRELHVDPIEAPSVRARKLRIPEQLPPGFDSWFLRAVARDPLSRFRQAADALAALRPVLSEPGEHALEFAQTLEVPVPTGRSSTRPMGSVTPSKPSVNTTLPMGAVAPSLPPTEAYPGAPANAPTSLASSSDVANASELEERATPSAAPLIPSNPAPFVAPAASLPPPNGSRLAHPNAAPAAGPSSPSAPPFAPTATPLAPIAAPQPANPSSHPPTGGNAGIRLPQPANPYTATAPSYAPMASYPAPPYAPAPAWQPVAAYPPERPNARSTRVAWIVLVLVVGLLMAGVTAVIVWIVLTISTGRTQAIRDRDPLALVTPTEP